jgi:hypothetical protein
MVCGFSVDISFLRLYVLRNMSVCASSSIWEWSVLQVLQLAGRVHIDRSLLSWEH